ncbi:hypothetical protein BJ165DRAFT_1402836 [Panaeolus papilionaceus]|nr:hypothetical protein BJ165DRAFT_1402836 [Panaeolus papilionaceus]
MLTSSDNSPTPSFEIMNSKKSALQTQPPNKISRITSKSSLPAGSTLNMKVNPERANNGSETESDLGAEYDTVRGVWLPGPPPEKVQVMFTPPRTNPNPVCCCVEGILESTHMGHSEGMATMHRKRVDAAGDTIQAPAQQVGREILCLEVCLMHKRHCYEHLKAVAAGIILPHE